MCMFIHSTAGVHTSVLAYYATAKFFFFFFNFSQLLSQVPFSPVKKVNKKLFNIKQADTIQEKTFYFHHNTENKKSECIFADHFKWKKHWM